MSTKNLLIFAVQNPRNSSSCSHPRRSSILSTSLIMKSWAKCSLGETSKNMSWNHDTLVIDTNKYFNEVMYIKNAARMGKTSALVKTLFQVQSQNWLPRTTNN